MLITLLRPVTVAEWLAVPLWLPLLALLLAVEVSARVRRSNPERRRRDRLAAVTAHAASPLRIWIVGGNITC